MTRHYAPPLCDSGAVVLWQHGLAYATIEPTEVTCRGCQEALAEQTEATIKQALRNKALRESTRQAMAELAKGLSRMRQPGETDEAFKVRLLDVLGKLTPPKPPPRAA